jgi:hypothetical protein
VKEPKIKALSLKVAVLKEGPLHAFRKHKLINDYSKKNQAVSRWMQRAAKR